MPPGGEAPGLTGSRPRALAFYLPQFHPIPENDRFWGKGFTEWANVTRGRPLFPGHYQPHLPSELGYYDLRVPEVREAQAELARNHGISGFIYYHYWFTGRRLLERPFEEVLSTGSPDFPFALCWCNEAWTRNWDSYSGELLVPQHYTDEDDLEHIRWLIEAFSDDRYIKINGRPLVLIYRPSLLPEPTRMTDLWRGEAQRAGFPDLFLCWVESWGYPPGGPEAFGLDATVGFMPQGGHRVHAPFESHRDHSIIDYQSAYEAELARPAPPWKRFPGVMVGWDNTARRRHGATIYEGATPAAYQRWLEGTAGALATVPSEENYLFVMAWNEWAEGNHLEPDQRYGRGYLEATRAVLLDPLSATGRVPVTTPQLGARVDPRDDVHSDTRRSAPPGSPVSNAMELLRHVTIDPNLPVVELGSSEPSVPPSLAAIGRTHRHLPLSGGIRDVDSPSDGPFGPDGNETAFGPGGDVGALLLLDALPRLAGPHTFLSDLSAWSLKHGEPHLIVSVPNVAHFDIGLNLLCGRFAPSAEGALGAESLHLFTEQTLRMLLERCGWQLVAREDASSIHSEQYNACLLDEIPEALVGALRVLSKTYNDPRAVTHFVWALAPRPVKEAVGSYTDAVLRAPEPEEITFSAKRAKTMQAYLESVGLVASEVNRRGAEVVRRRGTEEARRRRNRTTKLTEANLSLPGWKRGVLNLAYGNPVSGAVFKRIYGWFH
jgi:Glycosyltransferase WbsX